MGEEIATIVVASTPPPSSSTATCSPTVKFNQFDVVTDHLDHHYYCQSTKNRDIKKADLFTNVSSSVHKKIMQEWKFLDKNLPASIYVRACEHRINLLRAAIIGADGTPYQDFLFFFDIIFPADYPNKPPNVCYRSFGFRLNPNLYQNGLVCLSLLNTWSGKGVEKWDPVRSNILQVLLSIQALVLNEKPFFNEPGYASCKGRSHWEKMSDQYNENAFILCCRSALCLLRNPPRNFESFVQAHFQERGNRLLAACDAYRNGEVKIGKYTMMDSGFEKRGCSDVSRNGRVRVSSKFRDGMEKMYPELVTAILARNGGLVSEYLEIMRHEDENEVRNKQQELGKKKTSIGFVGKLKMIFMELKKKIKEKPRNGNIPKIQGVH